jgi:hypothetical protein
MDVYRSRPRLLLHLLGSSAFVLAGAWIATRDNGYDAVGEMVGWVVLVFFGLCALAVLTNLLREGLCVRLDRDGLLDTRLGLGVVPWSEIESTEVGVVCGRAFLCLRLRDEAAWLLRMSPVRRAIARSYRWLGLTPFVVNLAGTTASLESIRARIQESLREPT